MKKSIVSILVVTGLAIMGGCATTDVGDVHYRQDIEPAKSVIAFPLLLVSGEEDTPLLADDQDMSVPSADAAISQGFGNVATQVTTVPRAALNEIPNAYDAIGKIIELLDQTSTIEQIDPDGVIVGFLQQVSSQFGDGGLGFGLVFVSPEDFEDAKQPVPVNMGVFNTSSLTWEWITKVQTSPGLIPEPYLRLVNTNIDTSFDVLDATRESAAE